MKRLLTEYLFVYPLYLVACLLRLVSLSCRAGANVHNRLYHKIGGRVARGVHHRKFEVLAAAIAEDWEGVLTFQRRVYTSAPRTWKHALRNTFVRKFVVGGFIRSRLKREGHIVPAFVTISPNTPSSGCNLACTTCYADAHPAVTMPYELLDRLVREQEELGIYTVLFLGGEPFLYRRIWDIFPRYPHTTFYVSTNGTHTDHHAVRRLADLGNVVVGFSLEGFREETDSVRGRGVFDQVIAAMKHCRDARLPFGANVTVTRQNFHLVTSNAFLSMLDEIRCCAIYYSCYVAVGSRPNPAWEPTTEQVATFDEVKRRIGMRYGMLPSIGRNGSHQVTGCYAAREYIHVLPDGSVESCPFAQWADPHYNVRKYSLLDVIDSPFFRGIRAMADAGVPGVVPCRATRLVTVGKFFRDLGAQPTSR